MHPKRTFPIALSSTAVIVFSLFVTTMEGFNLVVFGQALPLLLDDTNIHLTSAGAGLLGAMVYLGSLPTTFIATILAEKLGRHRILLLCALLFTVGSVLSAVAASAILLGLARFICGLAVGGAVTTAMTLARNNAKPHRVSLVITITMAGIPAGGTIASLLSVALEGAGFTWRSFFWVGAIVSALILVLLACTTAKEPTEVLESDVSSSGRILALFRGRMLLPVVSLAMLSMFNMLTWLGVNAWLAESIRSAGHSLQVALSFGMVLSLSAIAGSFVLAWCADRLSSTVVTAVASSIALIGLLGLFTGSVALPLAIASTVLLGIGGHSTQILLSATASKAVAPESRGSILAITNSTSSIGSFFGPIVGGAAYGLAAHSGVFLGFSITMGICVIFAWIVFANLRKNHPAVRPQPVTSSPTPPVITG